MLICTTDCKAMLISIFISPISSKLSLFQGFFFCSRRLLLAKMMNITTSMRGNSEVSLQLDDKSSDIDAHCCPQDWSKVRCFELMTDWKLLTKPDALMINLPKSSPRFPQLRSIVLFTAFLMNEEHSVSFAAWRAFSAMAINVRNASEVDAALTLNAPDLPLAVH